MKTRTIQATFRGGPLDGRTQEEEVPISWFGLRQEYKHGDQLHRYYGQIEGDRVELQYKGVESWDQV